MVTATNLWKWFAIVCPIARFQKFFLAFITMTIVLVGLAGSGTAATVTPGGDPDTVIDILADDFVIAIAADGNGNFNQRYRNLSGGTIDQLNFRFSPSLPASPKAESKMFGSVMTRPDLVVFDLGGGSGIPLAAVFRIRMGGLVPFTASAFGAVDPGPILPNPPPPAVPLPPAGALLASVLCGGLLHRQWRRAA
jgi:hypothetical protein